MDGQSSVSQQPEKRFPVHHQRGGSTLFPETVPPYGMSGENNPAPPAADTAQPPVVALDDATSSAISALVAAQLKDAFEKFKLDDDDARGKQAAPAPVAAVAQAPPAADQPADEEGSDDEEDKVDPDSAPAPAAGQGDEFDYDQAEEDEDPAGAPATDDGHQAFTEDWYEARRSFGIPLRFEIPRRFENNFPVGFTPESVEHYRTFTITGTSRGRAAEANSLYVTAAYLTQSSNVLSELVSEIAGLLPRIRSVSDRETLRQVALRLSDAQLTSFGVYELAASRYEVLCGLQGVSGVADPELLSAYIDPPAAYSTAGRQAFRRQQTQAIRYAAQAAGRRRGADAPRALRVQDAAAPAAAVAPRGGRGGRGRGRGRGRGQ